VGVDPIEALSVLAQLAVIVRLWGSRAAYGAFLTLMAYSVFFHLVALFSDHTKPPYARFWSLSIVILVALQVRATLELLRRWIAEYPGLRLRLLLAGGLVAFVVGGSLLYAWPDPFGQVTAARVLENAAGTGLAVYLVIVCGLLHLVYRAARPNLRKHALLFTAAMVISAVATHIGYTSNWWLSPALIAVYLGYLTLSPAGEIPVARGGGGDPEHAYAGLVDAAAELRVAKRPEH
jgi:uncharacterized membrane protein SirB2